MIALSSSKTDCTTGGEALAMRWIVFITFILLALAACTTVFFVNSLKPTSNGAFLFFSLWLVLPYAIMGAALISLRYKGIDSVHWHVVAALVSIGGILFMADVLFWHPDAQGAIAVLMTPILQGVASVLLLPVASWVLQEKWQ